jgi:SAM-dependent methyltransferase
MSTTQREPDQDKARPRDPAPVFLDARRAFAERFLAGHGLEIGALHLPLRTPSRAHVRYVDRMPVEDLRAEYAELAEWDLTPVDVIDNGELLTTIAEESQDFIVANHFLEHCEDPIRTIETHLEKLKPGGVLFYAVPDKRYTFDHRRPPTPLEHIVADHEHGAERSRSDHYEEWARLVVGGEAPAGTEGAAFDEWAVRRAQELQRDAYSIHMHVWTQAEFLELILECRARFEDSFDIEAAARQGIEFIVVLRKAGPAPHSPVSEHAIGGTNRWRRLARRLASSLREATSRRGRRRS